MVELPIVKSAEQAIPSPSQVELLLSAIKQEPQPYRLFYLLAIHTGCRRGELCALQWSDLHMQGENAVIVISRSRSNVAGQGIQEGTTKSKRSRIVVVDAQMTEELVSYAKKRQSKPGDYIFVNPSGALIHPDTFTKHLKAIYARLDFPDGFHLHTLRHYYVTTLLHRGIDKRTVADLVGHSDTSFLERVYSHPQLNALEQAAKALGDSITHHDLKN